MINRIAQMAFNDALGIATVLLDDNLNLYVIKDYHLSTMQVIPYMEEYCLYFPVTVFWINTDDSTLKTFTLWGRDKFDAGYIHQSAAGFEESAARFDRKSL